MMHMFSYGLGVDSTFALLYGIKNKLTGFRPDQLVAVTAMTGDEYKWTGELVAEHVLPVLAADGYRYVQLARAGQEAEHGYDVLSDSRATTDMVMAGRWRLSDEMFNNGTVPQVSSDRRSCSERAKGNVLDWWAAAEFGGRPYRHAVGFSFDPREQDRARGDRKHTRNGRRPWYPLIEWRVNRAAAQAWLMEELGVFWPKSCCGFCPFQASKAGIEQMVQRWRREPVRALQALRMDTISTGFNPNGNLFGRRSARTLARAHGLGGLVDQVDADLAATTWAVYDVRRAYPARLRNPRGPSVPANWDRSARGTVRRYVRTVLTGTADDMRAALADGGEVEACEGGLARGWTRRDVNPPYPTRQAFLVAAPLGVANKVGPGFHRIWNAAGRNT